MEVWSRIITQMDGTIQAIAHEAPAGFVEVSSVGQIIFGGSVDLRSDLGVKHQGTLLLDPESVLIASSSDSTRRSSGELTVISDKVLHTALQTAKVRIEAEASLVVAAPLVATREESTLQLTAHTDLTVDAQLQLAGDVELSGGTSVTIKEPVSSRAVIISTNHTHVHANLEASSEVLINAPNLHIPTGTIRAGDTVKLVTSTDMILGGAGSKVPGKLCLSAEELDRVNAKNGLVVGGVEGGSVQVAGIVSNASLKIHAGAPGATV